MSRWKRLEKLEEVLPQMSAQELKSELAYWTQYANQFTQPKIKKLAMKRVYNMQKALERKESM